MPEPTTDLGYDAFGGGQYGGTSQPPAKPGPVVIRKDGNLGQVDAAELGAAIDDGWQVVPHEEVASMEAAADKRWGGVVGKVRAGLAGLESYIPGSEAIIKALDSPEKYEERKQYIEHNPATYAAGNVAALALPGNIIGKVGGAVGKGAEGITSKLVGNALGRAVAKAAPTVARGAAMGGVIGANDYVTRSSLADSPMNLEAALAEVKHSALWGAALEGGFGLLGAGARWLGGKVRPAIPEPPPLEVTGTTFTGGRTETTAEALAGARSAAEEGARSAEASSQGIQAPVGESFVGEEAAAPAAQPAVAGQVDVSEAKELQRHLAMLREAEAADGVVAELPPEPVAAQAAAAPPPTTPEALAKFRRDVEDLAKESNTGVSSTRLAKASHEEVKAIQAHLDELRAAMESGTGRMPIEHTPSTKKTRASYVLKLSDEELVAAARDPATKEALARQRKAVLALADARRGGGPHPGGEWSVMSEETLNGIGRSLPPERLVEIAEEAGGPEIVMKGADARQKALDDAVAEAQQPKPRLATMMDAHAERAKAEAILNPPPTAQPIPLGGQATPISRVVDVSRMIAEEVEAAGVRAKPADVADAARDIGLDPAKAVEGGAQEAMAKAHLYQRASGKPGLFGTLFTAGTMGELAAASTAAHVSHTFGLGVATTLAARRLLKGVFNYYRHNNPEALEKIAGVVNRRRESISDAVDKVMSPGAAGARRAVAPAMTVLNTLSFGSPPKKGATPRETFNAVADDLRKMLANPGESRKQALAKLRGVFTADPVLADQIMTRKWADAVYLEKYLPRNPGLGNPFNRYRRWEPSDAEMYNWSVRAKVVDDPMYIFDLIQADALTPSAVDALQSRYPAMYEQISQKIVDLMADEKTSVPWRKMLTLRTFFRAPTDTIFEHTQELQKNTFAVDEEGEPADLGEINAPEPTPAQGLAGER